MTEEFDWKDYLDRFMNAYNSLPELPNILPSIAPLLFQYEIEDQPDMNFWQSFEAEKVNWGLGKPDQEGIPITIHRTSSEMIRKVLSGEKDAMQATMEGSYKVDGDMNKLIACTPLLPLNGKAHNEIQK